MKFWREAATLILAARPQSSVQPPTSEDYKVLMLRRSAASSFMPSQLVFPGGTLSEVDYSDEWANLFQSVTNQTVDNLRSFFQINRPRPPMITEDRPWKSVSADIAFRICAIRETFEESGILIGTGSRSPDKSSKSNGYPSFTTWSDPDVLKMEEWQKKINKNPLEFLSMCREMKVVPNIWALHEWENWLTPVFQKVENPPPKKPNRFDTLFYICCLSYDELPQTRIDNHEATHFEWKTPSEYLSMSEMGNDSGFGGPQTYELKRLTVFRNFDDLDRFSEDRGRKGLNRCMSVYRPCLDGFVVFLPGDHMYPDDPDFEGTKDSPPPFEQTIADLTDYSKNLHRYLMTYSSTDPTGYQRVLVCNYTPPYGHVTPVPRQQGVAKL